LKKIDTRKVEPKDLKRVDVIHCLPLSYALNFEITRQNNLYIPSPNLVLTPKFSAVVIPAPVGQRKVLFRRQNQKFAHHCAAPIFLGVQLPLRHPLPTSSTHSLPSRKSRSLPVAGRGRLHLRHVAPGEQGAASIQPSPRWLLGGSQRHEHGNLQVEPTQTLGSLDMSAMDLGSSAVLRFGGIGHD